MKIMLQGVIVSKKGLQEEVERQTDGETSEDESPPKIQHKVG